MKSGWQHLIAALGVIVAFFDGLAKLARAFILVVVATVIVLHILYLSGWPVPDILRSFPIMLNG